MQLEVECVRWCYFRISFQIQIFSRFLPEETCRVRANSEGQKDRDVHQIINLVAGRERKSDKKELS